MNKDDIRKRIDQILALERGASFEDFLEYLKEVLSTLDRTTSNISVCNTSSDWREWEEEFKQGDFDVQIFLGDSAQYSPAKHDFRIQVTSERPLKRIQILYEYYFDYLAIVTADIQNLDELKDYLNSIVITEKYFNEIERKKDSFRKLPLVGRWLSNTFPSESFGSRIVDQIEVLKEKSHELMISFQRWLSANMTPDDKKRMNEKFNSALETYRNL